MTSDDIPFLFNILSACVDAVCQETGLKPNQVINFAHYHPSFWHLHFHFKRRSDHKNWSEGYSIEKLIERLKKDSDYYKKATLNAMCQFSKFVEKAQVSDETERRSNKPKKHADQVVQKFNKSHFIRARTGKNCKEMDLLRPEENTSTESQPESSKKLNNFDLYGPPKERIVSTMKFKECQLMKTSVALTLKHFTKEKLKEDKSEDGEESRSENEDSFM